MTRVMFVHGLESGPTGGKVTLMTQQGLHVVAPDQHMSQLKLSKRNSILRQLLAQGEPRAVIGLGVVGLGVTGFQALVGLPMVFTALLLVQLRRPRWVSRAVAVSRGLCVQIARDALQNGNVQVVVGSSWGGAVASQLVAEGHWTGPTVLIAPATQRVQQMIDPAGWPALKQALQAQGEQLHIVHDPADEVVPIAGSREIAQGSAVTLLEPSAGGHRLLEYVEDGRLVALVRRLAGEPG